MACRYLLVTALLSLVVPAQATTVTLGGTSVTNQGLVSSVPGATTVTFNSLPNGGPQSFTTGIAGYSHVFILTANTADIINDLSPFADPQSLDMAISLSKPIEYFGLYWGSPDDTNTISFFNGSTDIFSYTGQNLHDQFGIGFGDGNAAYVNFTAAPGESYTEVVISASGGAPFEDDNNAFLAATPEPGTLLLTTCGVLLALRFPRRSRLTQVHPG